jgi:hypothetical protein
METDRRIRAGASASAVGKRRTLGTEKNIFKKWKILKTGRGVSKDQENTTNRPQKHHKKPSQNTHFSQKPPKKHTSGHSKKIRRLKKIGGGGGSRTHVRKNFQQRAFMLFPYRFCLVIDT